MAFVLRTRVGGDRDPEERWQWKTLDPSSGNEVFMLDVDMDLVKQLDIIDE